MGKIMASHYPELQLRLNRKSEDAHKLNKEGKNDFA